MKFGFFEFTIFRRELLLIFAPMPLTFQEAMIIIKRGGVIMGWRHYWFDNQSSFCLSRMFCILLRKSSCEPLNIKPIFFPKSRMSSGVIEDRLVFLLVVDVVGDDMWFDKDCFRDFCLLICFFFDFFCLLFSWADFT